MWSGEGWSFLCGVCGVGRFGVVMLRVGEGWVGCVMWVGWVVYFFCFCGCGGGGGYFLTEIEMDTWTLCAVKQNLRYEF